MKEESVTEVVACLGSLTISVPSILEVVNKSLSYSSGIPAMILFDVWRHVEICFDEPSTERGTAIRGSRQFRNLSSSNRHALT